MLVRSAVRPWQGCRTGQLQVMSAAQRPRTSLVVCSKAPRTEPSLHPRVRQMLEADPQLAAIVKENPRLLRSLGLLTEGHPGNGRRQRSWDAERVLRGTLISAIAQARSYKDVAALLHSAINQDVADVATTSAAFDRLRSLHSGSRQVSCKDLQAAFQLTLKETLQRLPDATPRSLAALARAACHLDLPVPQEEQQRIVAKFISLMKALQERHAAKVEPRPAPSKQGWVHIKLTKRGTSRDPHAAEAAASVAASGSGGRAGDFSGAMAATTADTGSSQPNAAQAGGVEPTASHELREYNQHVANFAWATLGNPQWHLPEGQLAALMQCVQRQPMDNPQDSTQVFMGLTRYASYRGRAGIEPYLQEGGVAEVLLHRLLPQTDLDSRACSDTLLSIGRLELRFPAGSLAAVFGQALADLEMKSKQPRNAGRGGRLRSISMTFRGLSSVYDLAPQECRDALGLPAARELAQEFAEQVQAPRGFEPWTEMLSACCLMGFNPTIGSQQVPLLEALITYLPKMKARLSFLGCLDVLASLGHVYGLPARGHVVAVLQPYRKDLAGLARDTGRLISQGSHTRALSYWRAHHGDVDVIQLLEAYAGLV